MEKKKEPQQQQGKEQGQGKGQGEGSAGQQSPPASASGAAAGGSAGVEGRALSGGEAAPGRDEDKDREGPAAKGVTGGGGAGTMRKGTDKDAGPLGGLGRLWSMAFDKGVWGGSVPGAARAGPLGVAGAAEPKGAQAPTAGGEGFETAGASGGEGVESAAAGQAAAGQQEPGSGGEAVEDPKGGQGKGSTGSR